MQQSDQLLITSLRDFINIPGHIKLLKDIKSDQLFTLSLSILQQIGSDIAQIKSIQKQKFKATTKLNQKLYKDLQIQLELNDLLNPTINFVRKTLLTFLTKLGAYDQNQNSNMNKQDQSAQKRKRKKIIKNWIDSQWIHPALKQPNIKYQAYKYPLNINRKTLKSNLLPNLFRSSIKNNTLSILTTSINKNILNQKLNEQNTGILRKKQQQSGHNINTAQIITSNFQDWNMAQQKLNKIKRKIQKDKQAIKQKQKQLQENKQNEQQQPVSVFQIQVQTKIQQKQKLKQKQKQKQRQKQKQIMKQTIISTNTQTSTIVQALMSDSNDNPLQKLKKQAQKKKKNYQHVIQQLIVSLNQKKQQVFSIETAKEQLQKSIQISEQKTITYKTKTEQLKKQVQKKQLILNSIQSAKPIQQQIKKYQQDIKQMQQQLKNQVNKTNQTIQKIKNQSDHKIQALQDLKLKLHRIQTQYKQVCEEIQDKSNLKGKIKINKSGISRLYYSKKISEIDKRWRQTQKESVKIKRDLQILQEKTKIITDSTHNMQRDIINFMDSDKAKNENQSKALKQIFLKCQNCFKNTMETLQKINQIKQQTRQYQVKVHSLTSQNYKAGIQKVNTALLQLKKQIQETSKKGKN